MSGCGAGCCDPGSPTATDDPGKSLTREKSTPLPPSRLSKAESSCAGTGPDGTRGKHCTPLQGKSFRKAVSAVMDNLEKDDKIIE